MKRWLDRQRLERAEETVQSYCYRVQQIVEWCEENGFGENMNSLVTRDNYEFDGWCRAKELSQSALNNRPGTVKRFLGFCQKQQAIHERVVKAVDIPPLVKTERVNEEKLAKTRAEQILEDLSTFRYGSREHAMLTLAKITTALLGALRALDVSDVFLENDDLDRLRHYPEIDDQQLEEIVDEVQTPFVYYRRRPPETPLKNRFTEVVPLFTRTRRQPIP